MNAYQAYTVGFFTSDDECTSYQHMLDTLFEGDPDGLVTPWEPFEGVDPRWLGQRMHVMTEGLNDAFVPRPAYKRLLKVADNLVEAISELDPDLADDARESLTNFRGV